MSLTKINRNLRSFCFISLALICSGCSLLGLAKWHKLALPQYGIEVSMPGKARHFTLHTQGVQGTMSFEEWTVTDNDTGEQYMLVVQDFKNSAYSGNTSQWLLANAPRANIGFLSNAEVQQSENLWQEGVIYEKKKLKLKNRKMAVTRTYAVNDLLVMLLCSYPKQEKLSSNGEEFLNSLIIK